MERTARRARESPTIGVFAPAEGGGLWSLAGATPLATGWQITLRRKRLKQAKTVVVRCDRLPLKCHGKERGRRFAPSPPRVVAAPIRAETAAGRQEGLPGPPRRRG